MTNNQSDDWKLDANGYPDLDHKSGPQAYLDAMIADGGWFLFCEYDDVTKNILPLHRDGLIEYDPNWNNRISGMVTSIRARAVMDRT